jgi:hypothetical protein
MNYPLNKRLSVSGDKTRLYWTLRALARAGYSVTADAETHIKISEKGWEINGNILLTIEDLLQELSTFPEI